jgi:ribosomal protein L37E
MENSVNTESQVTQISANTESWITENSANTENRVMQDSGGRKPDEGKGAAPRKRLAPQWCQGVLPRHKNTDCKRCVKESWPRKKKRKSHYWFNRLRPMTKLKQTWQEKQLAKEENGSSGDSSAEEEVEVTLAKGDSNRGSGNSNPELGNCNPDGKEDQ